MRNPKEDGSFSVCLVTFHDFPEGDIGGEERFLTCFSDFLLNNNIQVTIVSSATRSDKHIVGLGIRPFRLPVVGLTPYLLLFSIIAGIKIVLINKRRSFSLIHSMDTGYGGLAGLLASRILGLRFIVHSHCMRSDLLKLTVLLRHDYSRHVASIYEEFESCIDKLVSRNADLVLAVSDEIRNYITSLGVPSKKVVVTPVGLDATSFEPKAKDRESLFCEFGIPLDAFVIGYIGSLTKTKGVDVLIKAFSLFQKRTSVHPYLLMVGDGELEKEIRDVAGRMRPQCVILLGFRKDVARVLAAIDVFVLPSHSEGCPFSLLEAMAAGKAIIASNIPSIREIVEDEKEAILTDPNDYNMIEEAILRLSHDPKLREKLCRNAKKKARRYDVNVCYGRILELYHDHKRSNKTTRAMVQDIG
jgi:glycosyltransferase involved in cell wall biosynthesis